MISAADFADVFPWPAQGEPSPQKGADRQPQCEGRREKQGGDYYNLAQWETDGGSVRKSPKMDVSRS